MSTDTESNNGGTGGGSESRIEVAVAGDRKVVAEGGEAHTSDSDNGLSIEVGGPDNAADTLVDAADVEDEEGGDEEPTQDGDPQEGTDEDEGEPAEAGDGDPEPLPEYDPDNVDVKAQYDGRYLTEQGDLNMEALSKEYWRNWEKLPADKQSPANGGLDENTYAYLQDVAGVSKEFVKQIERGLVADAAMAQRQFYDKVGGEKAFNAALEWGAKGGYTEEQKARFNAAFQKGGEDAAEAAELLMTRYRRANPQRGNRRDRRHHGDAPERRPSSPKRNVTTNGAAPGDTSPKDTYASDGERAKEWDAALAMERKASTPEERRAARAEIERVRAKARRSRL